VVVLEDKNKYWGLYKSVREHAPFDMAISAKTSPMKLMNFFLYATKAPLKAAYVDDAWHCRWVNRGRAYEPKAEIHQALKCLHLIDPTLRTVPEELFPKFSIPPAPKATEGVAKLHGSEKSMVLSPFCEDGLACPCSADGGLPKRVGEEAMSQKGPKERFYAPKSFATPSKTLFLSVTNNRVGSTLSHENTASLLNRLFEKKDFSVVVNCEPKDEKKGQELKQILHMPAYVVPTPSFDAFLKLLASCEAAFVGDGGVMHLAAALDKPQVVLFGGTKIWEWAPLSKKAICLGHLHNVNDINPAQILEALDELW
jgi:ADP-heptose:LPS heptosyltransferase